MTELRPPDKPHFDGPAESTEGEDNRIRLGGQLGDVYDLMSDGEWRLLRTIAQVTGHPPASVSAQLRHLRKARFGSYKVEKMHLGKGLYSYRVTG